MQIYNFFSAQPNFHEIFLGQKKSSLEILGATFLFSCMEILYPYMQKKLKKSMHEIFIFMPRLFSCIKHFCMEVPGFES